MSLRAVIAVVRARWLLVVIPAVLAVVVVFAGSADSRKEYDATATVRVTSRSTLLGATVRPDDLAYLDRLLNTYERLGTTKQMLTRLDERVGPGMLVANVSARPNTELLDVTITARDAETAVRGANELAHLLIDRVERLSDSDLAGVDAVFERRMRSQDQRLETLQRRRARLAAKGASTTNVDTQVQLLSSALANLRTTFEENRLAREAQGQTVTLVERASPVAVETVGSRLPGNLVLALLLGGLVGVGLALLVERLHPAPHTVDEIGRVLDIPVIGVLPSFGPGGVARLRKPAAVDTVKRLAAIVSARAQHDGAHTMAVVSAERGEGRTTVASSLAVGLAQSGRSVLLIDGDFRAPAVHETFRVPNTLGLSGLLTNPKATLRRATVASSVENLDLVPAGTSVVRTIDVTGPRLKSVLEDAKARYDVVLLDTSALLGDVDALQLAHAVDGVLLVAGGHSTRWATLERTAGQLQKMGVRLLGVIGNRWIDDAWHDQYHDPDQSPPVRATSGNGSGGADAGSDPPPDTTSEDVMDAVGANGGSTATVARTTRQAGGRAARVPRDSSSRIKDSDEATNRPRTLGSD